MSIPFPGHNSPAASTEVPLEMLAACHLRIKNQCATLVRLVGHLAQHGADEQARSAATNIMRYFDTAAVDHHADEEENLFPALLESMAGSDAVCIRELTSGLTAQHRQLEAQWRHIRIQLDHLKADRTNDLRQDEVQAFVDLYQEHLQREDDELLPMANRLLSENALSEIGLAMRIRRGILDI